MSCGAACARQILLDAGIDVPEATIRERAGFHPEIGITLDALKDVLNELHSGARYTSGVVWAENLLQLGGVDVVTMADPQTGWHVGSALRLSLSGRRCIVTAAHVIEAARTHTPFGVTAVRGQIPYTLQGPPDRVDERLDVAAYYLPDDYPDEGLSFWPSQRVDATDENLSSDYLFVHGFPGARAQFSATPGGLVKKSLPYGVMLRR